MALKRPVRSPDRPRIDYDLLSLCRSARGYRRTQQPLQISFLVQCLTWNEDNICTDRYPAYGEYPGQQAPRT